MGIEGISSAKYLRSKGAAVTELDQIQGKDYLQNLDRFDIIVRSPGIKRLIPEIQKAEKKGVVITSQTKLFFDLCPCPIIGVTGTKGKGTTATLIYEMLKKEGFEAYLGGNIGNPPIEFLDTLNTQSIVVLELSSYQLEDLTKSPHIAVILMITQEHLAPDKKDSPQQNYHSSLKEYIGAKRNIVKFQTQNDFAIINRDYPATHEFDIYTEGNVFQLSRERQTGQGCYVFDGKVLVQRDGNIDEIIETSEIKLPGAHNLENVCTAVMAAKLAGVSKKAIVSVLETFTGLPHRLEMVGEVKGVRYYDDSFSTTPETAIAAIKAFKNPEILILGGAHKGSDFSELGRVIESSKNIKAIIGIGLEWPKIKESIKYKVSSIKYFIENAKDMHQIVQAANKIAQPGDVVLLSPACSSFDMFKDYKKRGDLFKEEVKKLKE